MAARVLEMFGAGFNRGSGDRLADLVELKTILTVVSPSELPALMNVLDMSTLFDCLTTTNSEELTLCCDVIKQIFSSQEPYSALTKFSTEVKSGLEFDNHEVLELVLGLIQEAMSSPQAEPNRCEDILCMSIGHIGHKKLSVAKEASKVIFLLAQQPENRSVLFRDPLLDELKLVLSKDDTVRYRVYELLIDISKTSQDALESCQHSGILKQLLNGLHKDDVLVQLNCIDLLSSLAESQHGMDYLDQRGIVGQLDTMMGRIDSDPLMKFLLPGLVKFFGVLSRSRPLDVFDRHPTFPVRVFNMLDDEDVALRGIAMETLAFIGHSVEGKLALEKQGNRFTAALKSVGDLISNAPSDIRVKAISSVANLISLETRDQSDDISSLCRSWLHAALPRPMDTFVSLARQPFTEIRLAAFAVFLALANQTWGQRLMNDYPGFKEYLMDRTTEKEKDCKHAKFHVVETLVGSPTAADTLGRPYFVRLREFYQEGPYHVQAVSEVAIEGS